MYVDHKKSGLRIYFLGDADVPPTVAPSIPVKTSQKITPGWRSVYPHFLDVGEGDEIPRVADFLLREVYPRAEKVVGGNAESRKELSDYQDDKDDDNGIVETEPANNEEDEIRRVMRLIKARQGQREFRDALIEAYDGKCAVTGCDAVRALEASHIKPHTGPLSNVVSNGLLLRSDIHTLFDLGLIVIHPESLRVAIDPELQGTSYRQFEGVPISVPGNPKDWPDADCLRHRAEIHTNDDDCHPESPA